MGQKLNPIQPPPSVDDLLALGSQARVGQVDFANRLTPAVDATPEPQPTSAPVAILTSAIPRQRVVAAVPEPVVAPEQMAEPEPVVEAAVEPETEPETEPTKAAPRSRPKPPAKAKPKAAAKPAKRKPAGAPKVTEPAVETEPVLDPPVIPAILPIANLSGEPVSAAAYDDEFLAPAVPAVAAPTLRMPMEEPAEAARPRPRFHAQAPAPALPVLGEPSYLGGSVQEVADAAIERLRDAENATLQHLAALEAEATRRAELLTAQAELDAELIRITARREAHAIISAARTQSGLGAPSSRDARQLAEISDAVSRFAESIESTLAPMHPYSAQGDQA